MCTSFLRLASRVPDREAGPAGARKLVGAVAGSRLEDEQLPATDMIGLAEFYAMVPGMLLFSNPRGSGLVPKWVRITTCVIRGSSRAREEKEEVRRESD
jgi:hypothetical protein